MDAVRSGQLVAASMRDGSAKLLRRVAAGVSSMIDDVLPKRNAVFLLFLCRFLAVSEAIVNTPAHNQYI